MPTFFALSVGTDIRVEGGIVLVGRHPECDIQLNSLRVSRRHCIFTEERGDVIVRDLASTNGTWINGRRVVSGRIFPGDEVSIAHVRFYLKGTLPMSAGEILVPSLAEGKERSSKSSRVLE
jgi:pSer/pThr/pTyr-binding forkhead associated (FHA) protein